MTKLEVYNLALNHVGMGSIQNLTDTNPSLTACDLFWQLALDDMFRENKWDFANVKIALVETTASIVGWEYTYTFPEDVYTIWNVYNESTVDNRDEQDFEVLLSENTTTAEKIICSDLSDAIAECSYECYDMNLYDAKFILALSYKLASMICVTLTGDSKKTLELMNIYNAAVSEAKRINFYEQRRKATQTSSYQKSR